MIKATFAVSLEHDTLPIRTNRGFIVKIVLLTHSERRALVRAIAPMYCFMDTEEGPTKGDIVVLTANREPILRLRIGE